VLCIPVAFSLGGFRCPSTRIAQDNRRKKKWTTTETAKGKAQKLQKDNGRNSKTTTRERAKGTAGKETQDNHRHSKRQPLKREWCRPRNKQSTITEATEGQPEKRERTTQTQATDNL
jgi:hypothetical protein